jgi:nicotinamide mononucleotide transporter
MKSLYSAYLTIGGHQITYREIIGNLFGLWSAIGGMRRRVWAWPVGIVGNVLLFSVFIGVAISAGQHAPLYGQAGRQVFFIVTSVYGWWRWRRHARARALGPAIVPRWATARERAGFIAAWIVGVAICDVVFHVIGEGFTVQWWFYLADAWIFVGSMIATFAMARGWVDFWLCWIAVDLVGVPELLHAQLYPSATLYAIYAGFVVWGFVNWRRAASIENPPVLNRLQEALR